MSPAIEHPAAAAVRALAAAGVGECVICAGARNSAFVAVLDASPLRVWHHFEERAAAFFALGRIRATGRPVAVCTTSGTAVAELLPAVIEARHQGLPLVCLTADRPRRYRGSGAPQAIEQVGIFGVHAMALDVEHEAVDLSGWQADRPLQVNVCLEEPEGNEWPELRAAGALCRVVPRAMAVDVRSLPPARPLLHPGRLVLVGDLLPGEEETAVAQALAAGGPVWAEASSGIRSHDAIRGRLLLGGDETLSRWPVRQVVRIGGVPSCRLWRDLEARPAIPVVSLTRAGYSGLARGSEVAPGWHDGLLPALPEEPADALMARDAAVAAAFRELCATHPEAEPALVAALASAIPDGCPVLTGNSLAVREWNLATPAERRHRVHALRGANGIDGNLSAFLGVAADAPEAWCVTGDLTTLYDLAAPWMLPQLTPGRRRFAVVQNGGGRIFSRLPSLRGLTAGERRLMENPHAVGFAAWAAQWGMAWERADAAWFRRGGAAALEADAVVVEVVPDERATDAFWLAWKAAAAQIWA